MVIKIIEHNEYWIRDKYDAILLNVNELKCLSGSDNNQKRKRNTTHKERKKMIDAKIIQNATLEYDGVIWLLSSE